MSDPAVPAKRKRKSGIPTGNAGEYFVMGELLRQGLDAQLADRNTKDYDILVRRDRSDFFREVQVKTVRSAPWYIQAASFVGDAATQVTVYVLLGPENSIKPVRYFVARNADLASAVHQPSGWNSSAFMQLKFVQPYEGNWSALFAPSN